MSLSRSLFLFFVLPSCVFAQDANPAKVAPLHYQTVAERIAAQDAIFEEQYESDLRNFPERATSYGDYRYNDKLGDESLAAIAERQKTNEAFLARLEAVPTVGFHDQDQLSHDVMERFRCRWIR